MSVRAKLSGSCDALLLALAGVFQVGLLLSFGGSASDVRDYVDSDTYQQHVEVIVVEAQKISRG